MTAEKIAGISHTQGKKTITYIHEANMCEYMQKSNAILPLLLHREMEQMVAWPRLWQDLVLELSAPEYHSPSLHTSKLDQNGTGFATC